MHQYNTLHRAGSDAGHSDRRNAERYAHAEHVALATQWGDLRGTLLDVSMTGGQMRLANGLVPVEGDEVTLRLVDNRHIAGRVAWIGADTIGIKFDRPLSCIEDILWLEQRGPAWFHAAARGRA